jgi:hypothetical protein
MGLFGSAIDLEWIGVEFIAGVLVDGGFFFLVLPACLPA